ncbi:MAG: A/G-specific adenine glycosylase [Opitutales bacterium]|nr:A/G-specific adenine glycosylase [Opitutales bacterium]
MMDPQSIGTALVEWFRVHHRTMPWRTNSTIYHRLVSEFMLQQTQVATVIPYFNRWIEKFPTLEALAMAPENDVAKAWEGLGYYARARNLHKTAQILVSQRRSFLGLWPQTISEWEKLPGVGHYTARALASIAQNQPIAVIDGNVIRVLCRLNAITQPFNSKDQALRFLDPLAQRYLPPDQSSAYNEAIMELGALICKPGTPLCGECPIANACLGYQNNLDLPHIPKFKKPTYVKKQIERIFLIQNDALLLHRASSKRLHRIYELPAHDIFPAGCLKEISFKQIGQIRRSIAKEHITEIIFEARDTTDNYLPENTTYIPLNQIHAITLSGPHRKWLNDCLKKHL